MDPYSRDPIKPILVISIFFSIPSYPANQRPDQGEGITGNLDSGGRLQGSLAEVSSSRVWGLGFSRLFPSNRSTKLSELWEPH